MFQLTRKRIYLHAIGLTVFILCVPHYAVRAEDTLAADKIRNFSLIKTSKDQQTAPLIQSQEIQTHASRIALAIEKAATKGLLERGVEDSSKALIDCQKETSTTYTMASGSSDAQQAHCLRF